MGVCSGTDYDLGFLIPYVVLLLALTGLVIWYETAYETEDSWPDTVKAIDDGSVHQFRRHSSSLPLWREQHIWYWH